MLLNTHVSPIELNTTPFIVIVPDSLAGMRLDVALSVIIPELSRSKLTNWVKNGHVLVNNQLVKPKDKIYGGERLFITPIFNDESLSYVPQNLPIDIVYEDTDILVINKQAGLTVHPGNGNWNGTLLNALLFHYPNQKNLPRAGIVHRLDKDTTGLMVVAKTLLAQTKLIEQLQEHSVFRIYRAIVEGVLPQNGTITTHIGRDPHNRVKMATLELSGKVAITHYRVLKQFTNFSYIECKLETGRTHQIRVHMRSLGHPLVGDPVYGSGKLNYSPHIVNAINELSRQALHAIKLHFIHPNTGEKVKFKIALANDMKYLLSQLAENNDNYDKLMDIDEYEYENDWDIIYEK